MLPRGSRVPVGRRFLRGLPGILGAAGRWPPVADHTLARLPRAASEQVFSLRCWYGSRTRDSQISGLVLYPLS